MKTSCCPISVRQITELQSAAVKRWHGQDIDNPNSGFREIVCHQHAFNYRLWHEEDIARSPNVDDSEIARVKRSIDKLNQQRNDWIEKIDDEITRMLQGNEIETSSNAPLNTETPGSTIDRLSILALRIYHLREQLDRNDVDSAHLESVQQKIEICLLQLDDLQTSLQELLEDVFFGKKRHRTYRQLKMYNDPSLNPHLYEVHKSAR